jgi:site-specific DNA-methyltransferase (adenine-specific)
MINLINWDCLEEQLPKCRLLLTDIPYEVVSRKDNWLRNLDKEKADEKTFELQDFLKHTYNCFDVWIIFCAKEQLSEIYSFFNKKQEEKKWTVRQLVWCKSNPSPMNWEYIYLSWTENAVWFKKSWTWKLNSKCKKNWFIHSTWSSKYHPTEKNHKLLEELILDNTNEWDLVIDTCMWSGSAWIVCKNLNRDFIWIELDKTYFEIAKNRIEALI